MALDKLLDVEIVTPQKVLYSGKAQSVSVPGSKSPFQVLYNHAPIVSSLDLGIVKVINESGKDVYFATDTGFAEVNHNKVSVLVENAFEASGITAEFANEKLHSAKELLSKATNQEEAESAKKLIRHAENLLKTSQKYKEN